MLSRSCPLRRFRGRAGFQLSWETGKGKGLKPQQSRLESWSASTYLWSWMDSLCLLTYKMRAIMTLLGESHASQLGPKAVWQSVNYSFPIVTYQQNQMRTYPGIILSGMVAFTSPVSHSGWKSGPDLVIASAGSTSSALPPTSPFSWISRRFREDCHQQGCPALFQSRSHQ